MAHAGLAPRLEPQLPNACGIIFSRLEYHNLVLATGRLHQTQKLDSESKYRAFSVRLRANILEHTAESYRRGRYGILDNPTPFEMARGNQRDKAREKTQAKMAAMVR